MIQTSFTQDMGIEVPLICGPMYPCSNLELVASVSEAGGIGIVQPVSLTFVHKQDFRQALRDIKSLTDKPIGMNALIEKSSKRYHEKMVEWVDIALEEGVRFFITSLGNPKWVVDTVSQVGGIVYHDVTERKWAEKGLEAGAQGLIAVNSNAGGHAGANSKEHCTKSYMILMCLWSVLVALVTSNIMSKQCNWDMSRVSWEHGLLQLKSAPVVTLIKRLS